MKYDVEIGSGAMICTQSFMKADSGIKGGGGGQQNYLRSLLPVFQNKENKIHPSSDKKHVQAKHLLSLLMSLTFPQGWIILWQAFPSFFLSSPLHDLFMYPFSVYFHCYMFFLDFASSCLFAVIIFGVLEDMRVIHV
jgi:hypothetical protein